MSGAGAVCFSSLMCVLVNVFWNTQGQTRRTDRTWAKVVQGSGGVFPLSSVMIHGVADLAVARFLQDLVVNSGERMIKENGTDHDMFFL